MHRTYVTARRLPGDTSPLNQGKRHNIIVYHQSGFIADPRFKGNNTHHRPVLHLQIVCGAALAGLKHEGLD